VDPEKEVQPQNRMVKVVTKDGTAITAVSCITTPLRFF